MTDFISLLPDAGATVILLVVLWLWKERTAKIDAGMIDAIHTLKDALEACIAEIKELT